MIVLDAGVLIAFYRKQDERYARAVDLLVTLEESAMITTATLAEILTFIKAKDSGKRVKDVWEDIKKSDIKIIEVTEFLESILYFIEKYEKLSFGDSSSAALMDKFAVKKIISFDSDFDLIPGIERIY